MMDFDKYSHILNGRIVVFYPEDQTADIKICVERAYSNSSNLRSIKPREILQRVPCQTPSGGGWSMTMPITEGDTCILFFNQVGYDHWLYEDKDEGGYVGGDPVPHLSRHFDENDGYALVGLNTIPRAIQGYNATNSEWRGADPALQVIRLKPDHHIEIESSVQVTVIAPAVLVQCDTATVDAETSVTADTPLFTITGDLVVDGSATVTTDLGVTGNSTLTGTLGVTAATTLGLLTAGATTVGALTAGAVNGVVVEAHTHSTVVSGGSSSGTYTSAAPD